MFSLRSLHRFAGLTLAVFIGIHLGNHVCALWGIEAHIRVMEYARLVYRNPFIETLLVTAICLQIPSGILLVRRKGWRGLPFAEKAQVASGAYLSFFLVAHLSAVLAGRYYFHLDTNFYFGALVLLSVVRWFFVVYYALSVIAVFTHIASIHYQKMLGKISPQRAQIQAFGIVGVGAVCVIAILLAFSGVLYSISIPQVYKIF